MVSLGPVLRQRVARHLRLAVESRAQEVFHFASFAEIVPLAADATAALALL